MVIVPRIPRPASDVWAMGPIIAADRFYRRTDPPPHCVCGGTHASHDPDLATASRALARTDWRFPLWPTASSTVLCTTPTASRCAAIPCGRLGSTNRCAEAQRTGWYYCLRMRATCFGLTIICLLALRSVAQDSAARLTGKVRDITGAGVSGTQAELLSETVSNRKFRTSADSAGVYDFSRLPTDEYTLKLFSPGFKSLTVKSIHILDSEQKALPTLQLEVGSMADCGGHAVLDYIRFVPSGDHFGNLRGSVRIDQGPMVGNSPPIAGADITLICSAGKVCGATKTNADGEFMFKTVPPGNLSVRVNHAGFYPLNEPGYTVEEGLESVYWSIYVE